MHLVEVKHLLRFSENFTSNQCYGAAGTRYKEALKEIKDYGIDAVGKCLYKLAYIF